MIEDVNRDELIEQYLLGKLSGNLLDEFKVKLAADDEFSKEVALQRAIIRNIKAAGRMEWARKLETMHHEISLGSDERKPDVTGDKKLAPVKRFYINKYILAAAASVLLILCSVLFIVTKNNKPGTERIFLAYYQPYPDLEQKTRSLTPGTRSIKQEAFKAYNEGNYLESIRLFKSILEKEKDEIALFYLGNAYLSAGKPEEAENIFKKYLNEYKEFALESKWYLSLSYLKQGKAENSRKLLEELAREKNEYSKKAEEILKK